MSDDIVNAIKDVAYNKGGGEVISETKESRYTGENISPDTQDVYSYLNIDLYDSRKVAQAEIVHEWAKETTGSTDPLDWLAFIKNRKYMLGTAPFGMSDLEHLYQYAKLARMRNRIDREMDIYTEGTN